jgi:hypothetical protein
METSKAAGWDFFYLKEKECYKIKMMTIACPFTCYDEEPTFLI